MKKNELKAAYLKGWVDAVTSFSKSTKAVEYLNNKKFRFAYDAGYEAGAYELSYATTTATKYALRNASKEDE